ncbi:hypothetical protein KUH03_07485 [Sphingobacterium sp. E70]|nr:hypothetical protein [Sphingobacterium sp. E70]ULT26672.1 hypothetical protein KUH03_07485 [Sphingobacterium sp. E70]
MNRIKKYGTLMLFTSLLSSAFAQVGQRDMNEPVEKYRPIYHFTPSRAG